MTTVLSVVTPSLNQERFIERTISSVLTQDLPGLEYVVCDGGSVDGTLDVLKRYGDALRWVSEPDRGQADAVNRGIRLTSGRIVGWLNSDDMYYPGALQAVVSYLDAHPDVDVVYGDADHIDEEDRPLEPYYTEDWDYGRLRDVCYLCQPAVFIRREVFDRFGLLDASLRYCMDYEYWLRIGKEARFARLPQTLAGSRMYAENKTLGERVAVHAEINDMLRRRLGEVPERWIFNYAFALYDSSGWPRADLHRHRSSFLRSVIGAFLRWRRRVPMSAIRTTLNWCRQTYEAERFQRAGPP